MTIKLGLYAIPFGFGPVSKAFAIAQAINEIMDVEWHFWGRGISLEFMRRQGMKVHILDISGDNENKPFFRELIRRIDGAIVIMDNEWADRLVPYVPVFFVDSLGFMWSKDDFATFPNIENVKRYYIQDLFGAYENLLKIGVKNIKSVAAIINIKSQDDSNYTKSQDDSNYIGRNIVHLGGLLNPINLNTTKIYLEGITQIIKNMNIESPLFLMSESAKNSFPQILSEFDSRSLSHGKAISAIRNAKFVWTSPGLTTMLELGKMRVKTAPLPPQNYSQALNVRNMVREFGNELHEVWFFLDREYSEIVPGMPEDIGVVKITDLNTSKLTDSGFQDAFKQVAKQANYAGTTLPEQWIFLENGANIIAQDIKTFF